jgi:hypothetical protein
VVKCLVNLSNLPTRCGASRKMRPSTSTLSPESMHTSAYVSIRQHTSAYVSIRQHTSAYVSIRQHTSAYVSIRQHTPAYVSIRHSPESKREARLDCTNFVSAAIQVSSVSSRAIADASGASALGSSSVAASVAASAAAAPCAFIALSSRIHTQVSRINNRRCGTQY